MPAREISRLTLQRSMCYGPCPAYTVSVDEGGNVTWKGDAYVKEGGHRSWRIPAADVATLAQALIRLRFDQLEESYSEDITDLAACTIVIRYTDGGSKRVHHYGTDKSAPKRLIALQNRIDRILGTKPYVGIPLDYWRTTWKE